jgi:hypothetical protein
MKKFEGSWHIQPFTLQTILVEDAPKPGIHQLRMLPNPLVALQTTE